MWMANEHTEKRLPVEEGDWIEWKVENTHAFPLSTNFFFLTHSRPLAHFNRHRWFVVCCTNQIKSVGFRLHFQFSLDTRHSNESSLRIEYLFLISLSRFHAFFLLLRCWFASSRRCCVLLGKKRSAIRWNASFSFIFLAVKPNDLPRWSSFSLFFRWRWWKTPKNERINKRKDGRGVEWMTLRMQQALTNQYLSEHRETANFPHLTKKTKWKNKKESSLRRMFCMLLRCTSYSSSPHFNTNFLLL